VIRCAAVPTLGFDSEPEIRGGVASEICDLWDWYSMRDQETSQAEVLLLQSLHFFSGHLRAWKCTIDFVHTGVSVHIANALTAK
jgi:hypothetical protein